MPNKRRKPAEHHTILSIRVERFDAGVEAGLNLDLVTARPFRDSSEGFVYEYATRLVIHGEACYPAERLGEKFEITLRAKDSADPRPRLKDVQVRDEHRVPVYREYRGVHLPVYDPPSGLATLERRRGDRVWEAYLFVERRLTTDMLILLGHNRALYLYVHEMKAERQRWIRSIALQTTDPATE